MDYQFMFNLNYILMILVLFGAINWGLIYVFNINPVKYLPSEYRYGLYILIALAGVYFAISRDTYLPFLGPTILPCNALSESRPNNAEFVSIVKVPKNSKVLYWAAEPGQNSRYVWDAYGNFSNMGIVVADELGNAKLTVRKPGGYYVNKFGVFRKTLEPHIHYRYCEEHGILSPVHTKFI